MGVLPLGARPLPEAMAPAPIAAAMPVIAPAKSRDRAARLTEIEAMRSAA